MLPPQSPSPPQQPPLPPLPPPPRTAVVGDDPIFVGADGLAYEVRGEPRRIFNLVTTSGLSINAVFISVPEHFRAEDISGTVLGTVGLAFCSVRGGVVHMGLDAATGNLTYMMQNAEGPSVPTPIEGSRAADIAAFAGAKLVEEHFLCDLRRVGCFWQALGGADRLDLPLMRSAYTRLKLRTSEVQATITRNAMVDFGVGTRTTGIDCAQFARWPTAASACLQLLNGTAPRDRQQEWAMILALPSLQPERYFYFTQVELPQLQTQAHGLLGQRAASVEMEVGDDAHAQQQPPLGGLLAGAGEPRFGPQGEGAIAGHFREYLVHSLHSHAEFRYSRFSECRGSGSAGRSPQE